MLVNKDIKLARDVERTRGLFSKLPMPQFVGI